MRVFYEVDEGRAQTDETRYMRCQISAGPVAGGSRIPWGLCCPSLCDYRCCELAAQPFSCLAPGSRAPRVRIPVGSGRRLLSGPASVTIPAAGLSWLPRKPRKSLHCTSFLARTLVRARLTRGPSVQLGAREDPVRRQPHTPHAKTARPRAPLVKSARHAQKRVVASPERCE